MSTASVVEINYAPGPVATRFHADRTSRVKLLIGPVGTGKTSSASWDLIDCASRRVVPVDGAKRTRFAVIRNTYPQLRDTVIRTYLDWWGPLGAYRETEKTLTVRMEAREIEILFRALDSPQDVRSLLSLELTGAQIDEAREIHQDVFAGLLGRVGRYPSLKSTGGANPFTAPPQIVMTTNYPSSRHWLYRDFVSAPVEGYAIYEQDQEENRRNLRPGYYQDLERDYAHRPDLLRTMVQGEWGITIQGRSVYSAEEWRRKIHVAQHSLHPTTATQIVRGWDNTGLSPAVVLTYFTAGGQWRVFREFVFANTGIMEATEAVMQWCARELPSGCTFRDFADPAGRIRDTTKQSPADYIARRSMELGRPITLEDGIQTFKVRRESVAGRLRSLVGGEPALLVDPACEVLVEGFEGGYSYPEIGASGEFRTEPTKNLYSHCHDALAYAATRLFGYEREQEEDEEDYYARQRMSHPRGRSTVGGY